MEFSKTIFCVIGAFARPTALRVALNPKKKNAIVTVKVAKENFSLYLLYSHALCDIFFFFFVNS